MNLTWPDEISCNFHHTYHHLHAKHLFIGILYDYLAYNTNKNHLLLLLLNHLPPLLILPAKNIYELPNYIYTYLPCNFMKYVYHCIVLIIVHTYGKWINHFIQLLYELLFLVNVVYEWALIKDDTYHFCVWSNIVLVRFLCTYTNLLHYFVY